MGISKNKSQGTLYPVPANIQHKLRELRGLIVRLVVSRAAIVLAIWLIGAFWLFGTFDYLPIQFGAAESPKMVRIVMLAIMVLVSLYLAYKFFWQLWWVRWTDSSLALLIEKKYPQFESALVTTVQAAYPSKDPAIRLEDHPKRAGFLALARARAEQMIDQVEVSQIVRVAPLKFQLGLLALLLILSCGMGLGRPAWTAHWWKRLIQLSDMPWPRLAQLGIEGVELDIPTFTGRSLRQRYMLPFIDGVAMVPKGQSCQLRAWASLAAKLVPELCTVYYRDATGNRGRANMRRLPNNKEQQPFILDGPPLESLTDSLWLSVAGGDSRIPNLELRGVDAPIVADLRLDVEYPKYLQRSTKVNWGKETIPYRAGTRLPQGTQVKLHVTANKEIRKCEYVLVRSGENRELHELPEETIVFEKPSAEFPLPIGELNGNIVLEMRLWGADGICSTRVQQFAVSSITDQPPQVDLVLQGIGTSITENAILPIASKIRDDYDIQTAWVEAMVDTLPMRKSNLSVQGDGKATDQLDLKQLRETGEFVAKVGTTLGLTVAAQDYLDLVDSPHIGRANPIQLGVVTPDQLLIALERRELAMRARLEQIIGELSQLRDLQINIQKSLPANSPPAKKTTASGQTPTQDPNASSDPNPATDATEDTNRLARLQVLRSQQAAAQVIKSEGELRGVEKEIGQINQELINNRIDSTDRRSRLEEKIRKPLANVLDQQWLPFATDVQNIEKSFSKSALAEAVMNDLLSNSIGKNNQIIVALTAILNDMIDIQDFNEVVDMVRGMLDDQTKILEKTKQEQKKQLLDSLK